MKKILYIGNKLENRTSNLSAIHTLGRSLEQDGFNLYYASSRSNQVIRLIDMIWKCIYLSRKVDVVLIDTYSTLNFYYALIISQLCRILNLKFIPILHGGNLESRLKNNPRLSSLIFKHSKVNIAPSEYIKNTFESYGFTNIKFIPNTIELKKYPYKNRDFKQIKMLWVRSFSKIYNPQLAVKVLKDLKDKGNDVELCMVGPDNDGTKVFVNQLAEELGVKVRFTGKLSKPEWIHLSEEYNIFINTTNFDNMPVSVIEAMALGLPIVSTNVGGMPYLINHGKEGLLVPPNSLEPFANAVKQLISHPKGTKKITFNAREKVVQLDWDVVKSSWYEVLK